MKLVAKVFATKKMSKEFLKYFLPVYFFAFLFLAMFLRSFLVWKKTGVNPYKFDEKDNAHNFIGKLMRLVMLACVIVIIFYSFWHQGYQFLTPIAPLQKPFLEITGIVLLIVSLVWILAAQAQMGNSWRIGVDEDVKTELVREGNFRLSRNPIFLGMRLILLGFFLVMPNALSLVIWILGDVLIQIQVRLEEEHLTKMHKAEYEEFCRQVRRWI